MSQEQTEILPTPQTRLDLNTPRKMELWERNLLFDISARAKTNHYIKQGKGGPVVSRAAVTDLNDLLELIHKYMVRA